LSVRDDGKGFDFDEAFERRMGLGIMTERAADIGASLEVISHPGSGTAITVEWLFPQVGDSDA
jgi:two-component system vancomycin resistance sensor histidine kinase VraS